MGTPPAAEPVSMRLLLGLVACAALSLSIACTTETKSVTDPTAAPAGPVEESDAGSGEGGTVNPSVPTGSIILDLGEIQAGEDVPFEIPAGALGFNVTIEGTVADFNLDAPYGIERIVDPKGKIIHNDFTPNGGTIATSLAEFDTIASVSVPQGENVAENLAGTWKLRVGQRGVSASKIKVKGTVRVQSSGDGTFHGGKLDLHLHVPDGLNVDGVKIAGDKADTNASLKQRVDTFFKVTSSLLGIDRGDVVWHAEPSVYAKLDTGEKIIDGFAVSKGTTNGTQSLHVLFTNEISDKGEPIAVGISPGIPGAATIYGRYVSGIIVATQSSDEDVLTMIHEAGHFFGLNHTTELDGQDADPLSDTPRCTTITDGQLQSCPDRKNIMFVAGAIAGPITLSASQKRVYHGSPIYKAFPSGTTRTMSLDLDTMSTPMPALRWKFRASNGSLSPIETELSAGYCGLTKIDPQGLVRRYGQVTAVAQLQAAAKDQDLSPIIRGRARVALKQLGVAAR